MPKDDRIEVENLGDSLWLVSAVGEHDLATAPRLDRALTEIEKTGTTVILDLTDATFIDSTVINTTIRHAQGHEGDWLLLVAPRNGAPRRVLDLIHTESLLEVFDCRDDALRAGAARERGERRA